MLFFKATFISACVIIGAAATPIANPPPSGNPPFAGSDGCNINQAPTAVCADSCAAPNSAGGQSNGGIIPILSNILGQVPVSALDCLKADLGDCQKVQAVCCSNNSPKDKCIVQQGLVNIGTINVPICGNIPVLSGILGSALGSCAQDTT